MEYDIVLWLGGKSLRVIPLFKNLLQVPIVPSIFPHVLCNYIILHIPFREVNKTFIIKSVIDPRDNNEISLQQAIMTGVINPETGYYINPDSGESKLIPTAMNEGLIRVSFP